MAMLASEAGLERAIRARRRARGLDGHDEVWDGVEFVPPIADNDHQDIVGGLSAVFQIVVGFRKLGRVQPGANVSDRAEDWTQNYRVPDILVFLNGNPAVDKLTHWLGGPDLAVEVVSRGDRSREKLDFYARTNVRELLCVDRGPGALELYRNVDGAMTFLRPLDGRIARVARLHHRAAGLPDGRRRRSARRRGRPARW